jgi:Transposase DDE domain
VVLFIQDTTELDYTHCKNVEGLGHIGDGKGRGIMLHNCVFVVPVPGNPEILGLAGQIPWLRSSERENLVIKNVSKKLLRTESEGEIWSEMVESIGEAPMPETDSIWISVGDRGSDIFSYIRRVRALHWHCLLRVTQNRLIIKPDQTKGYLKTFARALEPIAQKTVVLRGRNGEPKRDVNLLVAWSKICIQPPATGSERKQQQIAGWCIRAWEVGSDLEWILFTTVPITDTSSVLMQLDWYSCRWIIEEYHKCLKTGCAVEKRQLESADSLVTLLGFFAVVAVRLLQLRELSRAHPDLPSKDFVPKIMVSILVSRLNLPSQNLSVGEFWIGCCSFGWFSCA